MRTIITIPKKMSCCIQLLLWCKNRPKEQRIYSLCNPQDGISISHSERRALIETFRENMHRGKWVIQHLYLINLSHLCTYLVELTREHHKQIHSCTTYVPQKPTHHHPLISADLESRSFFFPSLQRQLLVVCRRLRIMQEEAITKQKAITTTTGEVIGEGTLASGALPAKTILQEIGLLFHCLDSFSLSFNYTFIQKFYLPSIWAGNKKT